MLSREESSGVRPYGHCSRSWETILLRKVVLEASESDQKWEINTDVQGEAERCYDANRQLCFYWWKSETVGEQESKGAEV